MLSSLQQIVSRVLTTASSVDFHSMMWKHQYEFLSVLVEKGKLPPYPVDVTTKQGQQVIRDLIRDAADELHEARLTLKNSKSHRSTEVQEFDRDHYIEEIVDCIKFCLGALIYAGVSQNDFIKVFCKKTAINQERQKAGY